MPELDENKSKYAFGLGLLVGFIVGMVVLVFFGWMGPEVSGELCWMAGCPSAFITWLIVMVAWGKKTPQTPRAQYQTPWYPPQQYTSPRYPPKQEPPTRYPPEPYPAKERARPVEVKPTPPPRRDVAVVEPPREQPEPELSLPSEPEFGPAPSVPDVMEAIKNLPEGLPRSLWGWDWNELANAVATGERARSPDGRPMVKVKGTWYYADLGDMGTFLQESQR